MYGLPENLDLSFFVGKTLSSITFGVNVIYFNFDAGVSVNLTSSYQHQRKVDVDLYATGTIQTVYGCQNSSLMQLLEHSVASAAAAETGNLLLTFDNGDVLTFIEDPGPYECYQFTDGKNSWIV